MALQRIGDTKNEFGEELRTRSKGELTGFATPLNEARLNIIFSFLVIIAAVLVFVFLRVDYVHNYINCFRLYIFEGTFGYGLYGDTEWGLLARGGVWGVLWGVVAPICLLATAAFVAAGGQRDR